MSAASMSALRLENTPSSSSGTPAISAWPLTIGRHSTPEPVGELGTEDGLVETADHPLVSLQVAGIERVPAAVGGLDLGRDDGVGVDLRIVGPRRRLTERRHRQPVRVGMQRGRRWSGCGSSTRTAPGAPAPRSPRRRALRAAGDRRSAPTTPTATSAPRTSHRTPTPPAPADRRSCTGRAAPDRAASQLLAHGPTATPPARRPRRDPTGRDPPPGVPDHCPGTSPGAAVQVLRVVGGGRRRRRRVEGRHPQHRPGTRSRPLAGTCLNSTGRTERSGSMTGGCLQLPSRSESCAEPRLTMRRRPGREGAGVSGTSLASR